MKLSALFVLFAICISPVLVTAQEEGPYRVVERMPAFPGCEEEEGDRVNNCTQNKIADFLNEHCEYPEAAKKEKIHGRVIVTFVVDVNGDVTELKTAFSSHDILKEEALRVMNLLPKFSPGEQGGKAVPVIMTVPVFFRLDQMQQ